MAPTTAEDLTALIPQVPVAPPSARAMLLKADDLPYVELAPGIEVQVLHVDLKQGLWIVRNRFQPGTTVPKHYHTGPVYAVTLKGSWFYKEYPDDVNEPGAYLFEPAGSVHTLMIPADQKGPTEVWFAIQGPNVNMDEDDKVDVIIDAATMLNAYRALVGLAGGACEKTYVVGEDV